MPRPDLPAGTVTFLFTDVEGSTKLLHVLGAEGYAEALATHRRSLRTAFTAHGGVEVDTQGDAFFVAFPTAPGALAAADQARAALADGPIRVRIGLHTGTPHLTDEGYVGADVHRAARIAAAGHGGQILVSSATAALTDATNLRDLGEHRLKDLSAPERIYQLGDEEHPPLQTLHQTNLPIPATPFLGRESEVADIASLLERDEVRLVTLTGPGGTGKTRLALQAAASVADAYSGGVWWVPLAALRDPALVLESAAQALGAPGDLAEHIGDKRLLLLFDNFEHVLAAATDLAPLLAGCPNLRLLATSREPLHLAGEHEVAVDPLVPAEAVELFLTRAAAAKRDFSANGAVAAICERLDHLPLAIELAAARVKLLSPTALLERLEQRLPLLAGGARDLPERQRTLRATIEWSHELLAADEQRLFARLAVFRGGCTLEAAEAVAEADLDTLASLVDKSLLRLRADDRFWMLETIREFAVERLTASSEADELRRRHAECFLALAEEAEPHIHDPVKTWIERIDAEGANMDAALEWFSKAGQSQTVQRLAGSLGEFWLERNQFVKARTQLEQAVAGDARATEARARALAAAASVATATGDPEAGRAFAEEALTIYRTLGDGRGIAMAEWNLGYALAELDQWKAANELLRDSVRRFEATDGQHTTLWVTRSLAFTHDGLGEVDEARHIHEENLGRARALGNREVEATTLGALAMIAIDHGEADAALQMLRQSTVIFRDLDDRWRLAVSLCRLAYALARIGRSAVAAQVLSSFEVLRSEVGADVPWVTKMNASTLGLVRADLAETQFAEALRHGAAMPIDDAVEFALDASGSPLP